MTSINPAISPISQPVVAPNVSDAQENSQKEIAQAIENNSSATKTAANAALITSFATLLPMSILAYKTHNLSKTAEAFQKDAKPVLDGAKKLVETAQPITENVKGATDALRSVADNAANKANECLDLINTNELKDFLTTLQTKVQEADTKKIAANINRQIISLGETTRNKIQEVDTNEIVANINQQIKSLAEIVQNKVDGVNPEEVNKLLQNINAQVERLNIPELTEKFNNFLEKGINISVK